MKKLLFATIYFIQIFEYRLKHTQRPFLVDVTQFDLFNRDFEMHPVRSRISFICCRLKIEKGELLLKRKAPR